jgi:hypothetical protein
MAKLEKPAVACAAGARSPGGRSRGTERFLPI